MNNLSRRELLKQLGSAGLSVGLFGASSQVWAKYGPSQPLT